MSFTRHPQNPLIRPRDVRPSRPDFDVIGVFNAGATLYDGETLLLLRVAERPRMSEPDAVYYPHLTAEGQWVVDKIDRRDPQYDLSDPRLIIRHADQQVLLTSISHLRLARSTDGLHFTVESSPWLSPEPPYENYGVEDARITKIGETYYVNYSAVSELGVGTALVSTTDFIHLTRHGVILPPPDRDVTIFPEMIDNQYVCYHRPMPTGIGKPNIWLATSPDLRHWGEHRIVLQAQRGGWDSARVGGGAPPVRTDQGWLSIYHAADEQNRYALGAFLTPLDAPGHIIARSRQPILSAEASYETSGFFPNVVFTCGVVIQDGVLRVYYGASDEVIAMAEAPVQDVLADLA